ncbi:MAG: beta-N-acetylhexosaminidase [Treponema sp.]|jgi:hexosaminidase|nr:beta-N-acetylhexosaminidase [Treponema sp.]
MMKQLAIIPQPVSTTYTEGVFYSDGLPEIKGAGEFSKELETVKEQLCGDIEKLHLYASEQFSGDGEKKANIDTGKIVNCVLDSSLNAGNDEAYKLIIKHDGITVSAAAGKGMFNALQTFRQLMLSHYRDGSLALPCAEITDYPRFPWRGFMLDCARHFYDVSFIKNILDIMSLHHLNRFHWHLNDDQGWRLPVPDYPWLTEVGARKLETRFQYEYYTGGFYAEDDIRGIVEYAAARHIEVIPEIDLPGHASAVLAAYPGLGCTGGPYRVEDRFGIFEDVLCAGNNEIFDLAAKVFDTLARLFPSCYVHIGGDEVRFNRWNNCPKCQKRLKEFNLEKPEQLQSWITGTLVQMLVRRGKIAIGWEEILDDCDKFPLPKDTVVMSWRGSEGGIKASKRGHKVIMSPNIDGCYLDYRQYDSPEEPGPHWAVTSTVYKSYSVDPVTPEMSEEDAAHIIGGQGHLWSELIYAGKIAEYMIFPRLCALSEVFWTSKENRHFDDFSRRLKIHRERLDCLGVQQYRGELK